MSPPVGSPCAKPVHPRSTTPPGSELSLQIDCRRGEKTVGSCGAEDDRIELARMNARPLHCLAGSVSRHRASRHAILGDAALVNAGSLDYPVVRGLEA